MVKIDDEHLEDRIDRERERRKHKTMSKTARELLVERLTEIERLQPPRKLKPQVA